VGETSTQAAGGEKTVWPGDKKKKGPRKIKRRADLGREKRKNDKAKCQKEEVANVRGGEGEGRPYRISDARKEKSNTSWEKGRKTPIGGKKRINPRKGGPKAPLKKKTKRKETTKPSPRPGKAKLHTNDRYRDDSGHSIIKKEKGKSTLRRREESRDP